MEDDLKINVSIFRAKRHEWFQKCHKIDLGMDSIPKKICENIIEHFKYRWALCIKYKGRRLDKELLRKIPKINRHLNWKVKTSEINGIRVSYNDKFVQKLMNKDIREKKGD